MEKQGKWTKDEEGYMNFDPPELQSYFEAVTGEYHKVYDRFFDDLGDEEMAAAEARKAGYKMITDTKVIEGREEFATTYITPSREMDIWYESEPATGKRVYDRGFMRVRKKQGT